LSRAVLGTGSMRDQARKSACLSSASTSKRGALGWVRFPPPPLSKPPAFHVLSLAGACRPDGVAAGQRGEPILTSGQEARRSKGRTLTVGWLALQRRTRAERASDSGRCEQYGKGDPEGAGPPGAVRGSCPPPAVRSEGGSPGRAPGRTRE